MRIVYYIFLKPLSMMPMWVLYGFGGVFHFVLFNLFGYRKDVVAKNLKNSFPDKPEEERKRISKNFFRHLSQMFAESIKVFSISREKAIKCMKIENPEVLNALFDEGKSIIMVGGHYGNWEMFAVAVDDQIKHKTVAVYTPIKNKFLDEKMRQSRGRFGLEMITGKQVRRRMEEANEEDHPIALILAIDQSPPNPKKAYWMEFLNQDTGVLFGTERYSQEYDMPVVYGEMTKLKRGHFICRFEVLVREPRVMSYGEITKAHTKRLEQTILKRPDLWLWSHKRWKHKRPEGANIPPAGYKIYGNTEDDSLPKA